MDDIKAADDKNRVTKFGVALLSEVCKRLGPQKEKEIRTYVENQKPSGEQLLQYVKQMYEDATQGSFVDLIKEVYAGTNN